MSRRWRQPAPRSTGEAARSMETARCETCFKPFRRVRYSYQRTCSKACAHALAWAHGDRGRVQYDHLRASGWVYRRGPSFRGYFGSSQDRATGFLSFGGYHRDPIYGKAP